MTQCIWKFESSIRCRRHLLLIGLGIIFQSCESPEGWINKNGSEENGDKPTPGTEVPDLIAVYEVKEPVHAYDTVQITLSHTSPIGNISMPNVKYNLKTPFSIISDDMCQNDLTMGWAIFNGYAAGIPYNAYVNDFVKFLQGQQPDLGSFISIHDPWTYSTDDGKEKRWAMTSAIWPEGGEDKNYTRLNAFDALGMIRTGHSFVQHDVSMDLTNISLEQFATRFSIESDMWKKHTGIGLKIISEPNGDKRYVEASRYTPQICMSVCQNPGEGWIYRNGNFTYYNTSQTTDNDEHVTINALPNDIESWANGNVVPDYNNKAHDCLFRRFIDGNDKAHFISENTQENPNKLNIFGMHGIGDVIAAELLKIKQMDGVWVASIDEIWEYYYLKKFTKISWYAGTDKTVVTVLLPQYPEHQFRDITLNIETDNVTDVTFSNNVVTSGWRQNKGYCTINLGLETRMYKYITEYLNLCHRYPTNTCMKRDAQYLIDLLTEGQRKEDYQRILNNIYKK